MQLPISRLNNIITFGVTDTVETGTLEGTKTAFVPTKILHCAIYQRTQSQQYKLLGTSLEDTIVVAVRAQYKVDEQLKAHFKGKMYDIVSISRDYAHNPIRYDLITLKETKKVG